MPIFQHKEFDIDAYELVWEEDVPASRRRVATREAFERITGLKYQGTINMGSLALGTPQADFYMVGSFILCESFPTDAIYRKKGPMKRVKLNT